MFPKITYNYVKEYLTCAFRKCLMNDVMKDIMKETVLKYL